MNDKEFIKEALMRRKAHYKIMLEGSQETVSKPNHEKVTITKVENRIFAEGALEVIDDLLNIL